MNVNNLLARQRGLITRQQALAAGMTPRMIVTRLGSGEWVAVLPGVYRSLSHPRTPEQTALAVCLSGGAGTVMSHASAAAWWGAPHMTLSDLHVTVKWDQRLATSLATVHRSSSLGRLDMTTFRGLPVTTPARTLVDIAAMVDRERAEDAVDEFLCRGYLSLGHLVRRATALSARGRQGPAKLLELLSVWAEDEDRSTQREMRVLRFIEDAGLPLPERQFDVYDGKRFIARVDGGYPDLRIGLEFNSFRWHAVRRGFWND